MPDCSFCCEQLLTSPYPVFHRSNAIYTDVNWKNPTCIKIRLVLPSSLQDKVIYLITHSNKMTTLIKNKDKDQLVRNEDYKQIKVEHL